MSVSGAAEAYDHHVGRYGAQLAAGLMEVAGVRRGQRALDVGCGPGPLTVALAERLGAENVAAVDPSEPFVEACRSRVPGADVRVGAGERLPFADDSFDAVFAQLVVQLMDDRDAGVREMARVTRAGWHRGGLRMGLPSNAAASLVLGRGPRGRARAGRGHRRRSACRLRGAGRAGRAVEDCGLVDVSTGELLVASDYESFEDLWRPFTAGIGHSGACCASLDVAGQAVLAADVHRRLGSPADAFRLTAQAWWARATTR